MFKKFVYHNCSNFLDLRNLQEQVKKVTKTCSDLSLFEQIVLVISIFFSVTWTIFSHSVGQNNFGNKIPMTHLFGVYYFPVGILQFWEFHFVGKLAELAKGLEIIFFKLHTADNHKISTEGLLHITGLIKIRRSGHFWRHFSLFCPTMLHSYWSPLW